MVKSIWIQDSPVLLGTWIKCVLLYESAFVEKLDKILSTNRWANIDASI